MQILWYIVWRKVADADGSKQRRVQRGGNPQKPCVEKCRMDDPGKCLCFSLERKKRCWSWSPWPEALRSWPHAQFPQANEEAVAIGMVEQAWDHGSFHIIGCKAGYRILSQPWVLERGWHAQGFPWKLLEPKNSSTRIITIHTNFPSLFMFISTKSITGNKLVLIPSKAYDSTELSMLCH